MRTKSAGRVGVYVIAVAVVGVAVASTRGEPLPDVWVVAGLIAAHGLVLAFPVVWDPMSGRRSSLKVGTVTVVGFALPVAWGVVVCATAALLSGLHIRRYRTTPGGLALGASSVTLAAAGCLLTIDHLRAEATSVPAVAAIAALGWCVYNVAAEAIALSMGAPERPLHGVSAFRWFTSAETAAPAIGIGALGGYLALRDPGALLLGVAPSERWCDTGGGVVGLRDSSSS